MIAHELERLLRREPGIEQVTQVRGVKTGLQSHFAGEMLAADVGRVIHGGMLRSLVGLPRHHRHGVTLRGELVDALL